MPGLHACSPELDFSISPFQLSRLGHRLQKSDPATVPPQDQRSFAGEGDNQPQRLLVHRCQKSYHRDNWLVAAKRS